MVRSKKGGATAAVKPAVIFDFDGTIADSLVAVIGVFEDMTKRPEKFSPEQIDALRELSVPELMSELGIPKWKAPLLLIRGRRMIRQHMHGIAVHAGMADVLKALHAQDIPLYVLSSNSTENVEDYLRWHKLSEYFLGVYGGASMLGKAPRLLKLIAKENVDVANSWYVGDETRDVSAARSVGLKTASVTWGYNAAAALTAKEPDVLADTASALLKGLEQVWKQ